MIIKRPLGRHKKFRVLERIGSKYLTRSAPELDGVNAAYLAGRLSVDQAYGRLRELVHAWTLPQKIASVSKSKSELFVEEFWAKSPKGMAKPRKNDHALRTARSAYFELPKLLPRIDLQSATQSEVMAAMKHLDREKQRKLCSRINTLWAWAGRPANDKLQLPKRGKRGTKSLPFLSLKEVLTLAKKLDAPLDLYCVAAFGCGARPGEMFALTPADLRNDNTHVWIDKTWDQTYTEQDTKNSKEGLAYVIKECREALIKWVTEVPDEVKRRLWRKSSHALPFKMAADGATPYILRHSYARHMLGKNCSLTDLRMWMRSDMKTIETYYLKWVQTSDEMAANIKRFDD